MPGTHDISKRLQRLKPGTAESCDGLGLWAALGPACRGAAARPAASPALLDVGVSGRDLGPAGQAAASPLLTGARIGLQGFQTFLDHESGGSLVLYPLAEPGQLLCTPLATAMAGAHIVVPRRDLAPAGGAAAWPWLTRPRVGLQRRQAGGAHQLSSRRTVQADRLPGPLGGAVAASGSLRDGCVTGAYLLSAAITPARPRSARSWVGFEWHQSGGAHHGFGSIRMNRVAGAVPAG